MKQTYQLSTDYDRMFELVQAEIRPVFRTENNREFRSYPFKREEVSKEHFISTAKFMKFEFIDPESQSDYAECVNQLQEYKAYTTQAVAFAEIESKENERLRKCLREISSSAYRSQIISMDAFLLKLQRKCHEALNHDVAESAAK